ncbi:alpha/beta fold hydrolase [Salinispora arenicola]|uniref:alpha/beta fold hydrolase n=1 Tax=Salinispora arenicola TaxID=168697 RepID=UPI0005BD4803|nr:alpha/beta hydrolase [Salinispora arenicola]
MPTFSSFDGLRLAYHTAGEGAPVVCLAGGPGRASAYMSGITACLPGRTVVRLDSRGTGDSGVPVDPATFRATAAVRDVAALLDHVGYERPALLAHSSAANTAMLYALEDPDRISHLILIAPSSRVVGIDVEDFHQALLLRTHETWYPEARAAIDRWVGFTTMAETIPYRVPAAPFYYGRWDDQARSHAASEPEQIGLAAAEGFYADFEFDSAGIRAALADLPVPVLVVTGELDPFPTPRTGQKLAAVFAYGTSFVQPGGGHFPWLDDTRSLSIALRDHLTRAHSRQSH